MAAPWVLTVGLQTVRAEFNSVFPLRDKASDGSVGNLAHQLESSSGHNPDITGRAEFKDGDSLNEVRAIDVDDDLRDGSGQGVTAEKVVQYLVQKARSGAYVPFRYLIYNRRIWRRTNGWKTETYNGPSAHTEHIHFSGDYTQTADNWRGSLNLKSLTEDPLPSAKEVANEVVATFRQTENILSDSERARIGEAAWRTRFVNVDDNTEKAASTMLAWNGQTQENQANRVISELQTEVAAMKSTLDQILAAVSANGTPAS